MKRVLSLVISAIIVFGTLPCFSIASFAQEKRDVSFELNSDLKTYSLLSALNVDGEYMVPSEYSGKPVTGIKDSAFVFCTELTGVTIPNSITYIGNSAFSGCEKLSKIIIGVNVSYIGNYAFYNTAYSKNTDNWTDGVLYLDNYLLDSKDEVVTGAYFVKDGTAVIAENAFAYNKNLSAAVLPETLQTIGASAFYGCAALKELTIPNSVKTIGSFAFANCTALEKAVLSAELKYINFGAFSNCIKLAEIFIPNGVKSVFDEAFKGCLALTTLTVSGNVESIGVKAFADCTSLKHITINNGVKSIKAEAFFNTEYYNEASNWENGILYIGSYLIKANSAKIKDVTEIRNGTYAIADGAFCGCRNLKKVSIPGSVASVGKDAFFDTAYSNTKANWGNGILYIENYLVDSKDCTKIVIKDGTKCVANSAFQTDSEESAEVLYIPSGVTSIGEKAFYNRSFGSAVTIPASVKYIGEKSFGYGFYRDDPDDDGEYKADITIRSDKGSESETYAKENGFAFIEKCKECSFKDWHKVADATYESCGVQGKVCDVCGDAVLKLTPMLKLAAVKLVSVKNGVSGVNIVWKSTKGASGYNVYRKTAGATWTKISSVSATSYCDTSVKNGVSYIYTVKSFNSRQSGGYDKTGLTIMFLNTPKLLSISEKTDGVVIKWSKSAAARGYFVYRKLSDDTKWTRIANLASVNDVVYKDKTAAKSGVKYIYTVRAYNGSYASGFYSGISATFLTAPKLYGAVNSVSGVTIKWGKTEKAQGYIVYRKSSSQKEFSKIDVIADSKALSYTDKTAKSGVTYTYTVKAYNGSSRSGFYPGITVMCIERVKVKSCISGGSDSAKIQWNKVSGADKYVVFALNKNNEYVKVTTVSGDKTSCEINNLINGKTYKFCVKAYHGKTSGKGSSLVAVTIGKSAN